MRNRYYGLKRIKLRQSWNKYNLYNLSRAKSPINQTQTFFQQKWKAKAMTRTYHGETLREKQWQRMFRPRIRSVVPMNFEYLARHDGSEQALGRGSGLDPLPGKKPFGTAKTPYMNMVYAPTERRLDTAIFRALFASSTRQARQFVIHGYVKVNGKKMIYPGYQLNPGDMFQVEPDRVLYATGAPKTRFERRVGRLKRREAKNASEKPENPQSDTIFSAPGTSESESESKPLADPKKRLQSLITKARTILESQDVTAKKKQQLRAFKQLVRKTLSSSDRTAAEAKSLDDQLQNLIARLNISQPALTQSSSVPSEPISEPAPPSAPEAQTISPAEKLALQEHEERLLKQALEEARDNSIDPRKPYATPWRPREWMSAFAFIPRYLEVHHRVCSAVYLRHPVARPGLGEVPTPFPPEVNELTFNWYLRRR